MNSRILELSPAPADSAECVLYVMSRDQRVRDNHALLEAQAEAVEHELPLLVVFNLYNSLGYRRQEHYRFMADGLKQVQTDLAQKNIPFIVTIGDMPTNIAQLADDLQPRSIYFDFSPLRGARSSHKKLTHAVNCRVVVVDTHNIVPAWVASDKEEYAAHTIRRKLHRLIEDWSVEPTTLRTHPSSFSSAPTGASWSDVDNAVAQVPKNGIIHGFESGEAAASATLERFIETGLQNYADGRNDASQDAQSNLSPYLHYGQISSLRILLEIMKASDHPPHLFTSLKMPSHDGPATEADGIDSFVEELVVRKELADNFCLYNPDYDKLVGAKDWAKQTLADHRDDPREFIYTKDDLAAGRTHDELWNAAQMQLVKTGKMHGYMRMYWAKKILEWTNTPDTALAWTIEMNDTYHLDGGDPNGYTGIMWSIGGVHDRPWFNRSVYGTIRYMTANGIAKKFDTKSYIKQWLDTTE